MTTRSHSHRITIPLTREQYDLACSEASAAGKLPATWIRNILLERLRRVTRRKQISAVRRQIAQGAYVTPRKIAKTVEKITEEISGEAHQ